MAKKSKMKGKYKLIRDHLYLKIQETHGFDHNEDIQICTGGPMEGRCDNILQPNRLYFGYIEDEIYLNRTQECQKVKKKRKIFINKGPS